MQEKIKRGYFGVLRLIKRLKCFTGYWLNGMVFMKNYSGLKYLVIILFISMLIRLPGLQLMPVDDEIDWIFATSDASPDHRAIAHPPLALLVFTAVQNILGHNYYIFRFTTLLFGMLILVVTYCMAREIYGDKIARISALVIGVSFYSILASLQIDMEGSMLSFLTLFTLYSYLISLRENKNFWLFIAGLSLGLSLLTKFSAVLIIPVVVLYTILFRRDKLKNTFIFIVIGIAVGLLFPVVSYLSGDWVVFTDAFTWGQESSINYNNASYLKSVVKHIYRLVQFGTLLFLVFPLFSYIKRDKDEENILYLWICVYLLFYIFIVPAGNMTRYLMVIIPPLAILSSRAIHILFGSIEKKDVFSIVGVSLLFFVVIGLQNSVSGTIEPFTLERRNFGVLSENPDIWYYSTSGPLFRVSAYSFIFVLAGSILVLSGCFFYKGQRRKLLILFLSLNLAFNVLLVGEFLFHVYSPDYNVVMRDMMDYYDEHGLEGPLYSVNEDFAYFLTDWSVVRPELVDVPGGKYISIYYDLESKSARSTLGKEGGTAVILNLPKKMSLDDDSYIGNFMINDVDEKCELLKVFYVGEYDAGYIYDC